MKKLLTIFMCFSLSAPLTFAKGEATLNKESSQSNVRESIINDIIKKAYINDDISKSLEKLAEDAPKDDFFDDAFTYYQSGKASFYGERWNGRKTSNGEIFDTSLLTAAHKSLPFGTLVKVTNEENGKSVIVRINDRGPFIKGRVIDLTKAAFASIENINRGITKVKLEIIKR